MAAANQEKEVVVTVPLWALIAVIAIVIGGGLLLWQLGILGTFSPGRLELVSYEASNSRVQLLIRSAGGQTVFINSIYFDGEVVVGSVIGRNFVEGGGSLSLSFDLLRALQPGSHEVRLVTSSGDFIFSVMISQAVT